MKTLILLAALMAGTAQAGVIASAETVDGGKLLVTDSKADCKTGRLFILAAPSGHFLRGCWVPYDEQIFVMYADGDTMLYPMSGFKSRGEAAPAAPKKQRDLSL